MIDHESEIPVYMQVAAKIRARIDAGEWQPRRRLPSVVHLEQEYGVARNTVLQAISHLRSLGLVYTVRNRGSYVAHGRQTITAEPGMRITARSATEMEAEEFAVTPGAPVFVIERLDSDAEVIPAEVAEIRVPIE
ncbi:DNA-binding GntR family transcriptional regulator [Thermocatellispora tengchongensis]|uniref:DNA-binding GntR family transcriptional regulator n=1 Tax=Thermocatellispora tengchongensis TaxID=1073253 RepID=A0A840PKF1_9ACTN|nr:GntR family transcriptional regulator [Thermocatellispora tengchongensis]MBB5137547.1 DNA-binding GntR family transcriptional regulator [Thermocatellispora tengchongensis]